MGALDRAIFAWHDFLMLGVVCRIATGLDGMTFNEDDDALHATRLAYAIPRGWGFDTTMTVAQLWAFASENGLPSVMGRAAYQQPGGVGSTGARADLLVLDGDQLDDALFADLNPLDLLLAWACGTHVDQVIAHSRAIPRMFMAKRGYFGPT